MTDQPGRVPDLSKFECAIRLTPQGRALHQAILTAFAHTGQAPSRADLSRLAHTSGLDIDIPAALHELAASDLVVVDQHGELRAAYPFSPASTPHRVHITDGPTVSAMCAIDALGMSAMLGRPVTITSSEPDTGQPVVVQVDGEAATWRPSSAVVFAGATGDCCAPSADRTCGHINFFTTPEAAHAWAGRHPDLTGMLLDQDQALTCAVAEFGGLLGDPEGATTELGHNQTQTRPEP